MIRSLLPIAILLCAGAASASPATREVPLDRMAFTHPASSLTFEERLLFEKGRVIFQRLWLPAPVFGMQRRMDGLGPHYSASACARCHVRNGRGSAPDTRLGLQRMVLPVVIPGENGNADSPEPIYGRQIHLSAVHEHVPEAALAVTYTERSVTLADGTVVPLRVPTYQLTDFGYGALHPNAAISPRIAPPVIGLGLLEAIADRDILVAADPTDEDGDGISGRAVVLDVGDDGAPRLGRFGWRADIASVFDQTALAFTDHMGMSSFVYPAVWGDCQPAQTECREAAHGADPHEIETYSFHMAVHFSQHLAVPAREPADDRVFRAAGCAACHRPHFDLAPAEGGQVKTIRPYTDLLLHDMGDGLADETGREWRTPPLWGLGLAKTVNSEAGYLHDGRARTLLEAILWHGGEAAAARDAVIAMPREDREALLRFLDSL